MPTSASASTTPGSAPEPCGSAPAERASWRVARGAAEEPLGHHAPAAVPDADEEDVHASTSRSAASGSGTTR